MVVLMLTKCVRILHVLFEPYFVVSKLLLNPSSEIYTLNVGSFNFRNSIRFYFMTSTHLLLFIFSFMSADIINSLLLIPPSQSCLGLFYWLFFLLDIAHIFSPSHNFTRDAAKFYIMLLRAVFCLFF